MSQAGQTWEVLLQVEVFVHALVWQAVVLAAVRLHLRDEVHEVLGLREELQLFSVDQVAQFIFDLNDQLDDVEAVQSVVFELGVQGDRCLLGGPEVTLDQREDIVFNLIVRLNL